MRDNFSSLIAQLTHGTAWLELSVIALLLLVAWRLARSVQQRMVAPRLAGRLPVKGTPSLLFPLLGVLLLSALIFLAQHFDWTLHFAVIATRLLWAMVIIRMVVVAASQAFPRALWLAGFSRSIAAIVWCVVALDLLGLLPDLITWLDSQKLPLGKSQVSLWDLLQGVVSVFAAVVVALWLGGVIESRLARASGLDSSVQVVISRVANAVLTLIAILVGVEMVGLDITTLSVFGGALGVGLGFGMQKIASNYVSGFIILLDRSIRIGNLIQVGDQRGEVMRITTRYTVLKASGGAHCLVPNETLIGSTVVNESFTDPNIRIGLRVQVSYDSDVEHALKLLEGLALQEARVLRDPAPAAYLVSFDDNGITLELGMWIRDPLNGSLGLRSNLNRAILAAFRAEGIDIPFPQREVRLVGDIAAGSAVRAG
ncbi:MAG: mechanosensitive ion channel protein MscS [Candidatus Dactylopiibacterium carminicum]|uniref:Mechanosensitive ion channel protein MscS n=1 Tax=Candidatus Dactylopiibacterium carminicum TaxID=857335 RepID=A0A272EUW0_9RHOO|nr:mechanosensitive ion channel domain-containing protein [Candidatus Dactylopiibacterium carminicum]KAF7600326.1 mechanosensitive ion channel protein MscS [Candidatus Dactylopiibacterium carminicum]PAS93846.1 MAG: mechanosensitive ion channel protein MscS [Candidatus Dactylopiibacterium carminicum]PAT00329.1 MAG: hypothetical protein BSR46_02825 [Candidatus Dactylopiibacterium carminicum]